VIGAMKRSGARKALTASATVFLVGAGLTSATMSAGAATTAHRPSRTAVVVEQRTHAPFGKILYTTKRHALYYLKSGTCTGECLAIWPPLLMPKGKTIPKGASCLATAKFGHRLQVTYNRHRLYTFIDDSGTSVTGNGLEGFAVAKIVKKCK
jgi:predicted lipoprotein with Yx(FWY)xxD motif